MRSSGRTGFYALPAPLGPAVALVVLALWLWSAAGAQASEQVLHVYALQGEQSFVVPGGVDEIQVRAVGGIGYPGDSRPAEVSSGLSVSPGETLYLEVGGNGSGWQGGFNGGGEGGDFEAGGGGGATDLRTVPRQGAGTLSSRLLVAAGSGGDGSSGLHGGDAGAQGESEEEAEGGEPGTQTQGGSQGVIFECDGKLTRATDGGEGTGGSGGWCRYGGEAAAGGGGGGGLYGGGGGGVDFIFFEHSIGAGGGGGSSLVPEGGSVTIAAPTATPVIELSYANPETGPVAVTQPASPVYAHVATLRGEVSPQDSPVSACEFEYGTSVFYEASAPCTALPGSGDQPVAVEAPLEGLSDSTAYHFRIVATNGYGTTYSSDAEFTTGPHEPPTVSEYSPHEGKDGDTVIFTGTELERVSTVEFGSVASTDVQHLSPTSLSAVVPALAPGEVTVTLLDDASNEVVVGKFTLVEAPVITKLSTKKGPAAGGTTLVITGSALQGVTEVLFGSAAGTIQSRSAGSLTVTTPAHAAGKYGVSVVSPGGQSPASRKVVFGFTGLEVTGASPASGPRGGGTSVTVTGAGFAPGAGTTAFEFGKVAATGVECASTTQCTMSTPAAAKAGTVDVRASIVGGKGKSKKSAADRYTYE